jgi:hypothetical protein
MGVLTAYTKLANVLWTKELQRQFDAKKIPITAMSVHPGNVMSGERGFSNAGVNPIVLTKLSKHRGKRQALHVPDLWQLDQLVLFALLHLPHDGGYTPAWAAASSRVSEDREKFKGKYLVPYGAIEEASEDARRSDLAKELWETTERVLQDFEL